VILHFPTTKKEFGDFLNIQQKELRAVRVLQIGFLNETVI